jgi:hypothetical protein
MKAPVVERAPLPDTLSLHEAKSAVKPKQHPRSPRRRGPIDPVLKSWIDNVIVPALVDEWNRTHEAARAA